ncbi:MAG: cell division protein FtsX [Alphaproteobacteria bacterium]
MADAELAHKLQVAAHRRRRRIGARRSNQLIPENSISGSALTIVIAIMSFLACLTLGAVTLVRDASNAWQLDIRREVTIQVRPMDNVNLQAALARAAAIARQTSGVASVDVLDEAENRSLLEPWLGTGLTISDLPVPRLIVVRLTSRGADLGTMAARLRAEVPGALLDDHGAWASRLRTMAGATVVAGMMILILVFAATTVSIVFATRGAMAGNGHIVSVLHFVGAEDGFIAREFQRHFLLLGLRGGMAGAIAAAATFALVGFVVIPLLFGSDSQSLSVLFGRFTVGPIGYFGALGTAFIIALMTALTSRLTVYGQLGENR